MYLLVSIIITIQITIKKENWNVFGVVCVRTKDIENKKEYTFFVISTMAVSNQTFDRFHLSVNSYLVKKSL
jgi:hypothetical protein